MKAEGVNISPLLSVEETASYLGMSKSWCYQHLMKYCPRVKIGGKLKFHKEAWTGSLNLSDASRWRLVTSSRLSD